MKLKWLISFLLCGCAFAQSSLSHLNHLKSTQTLLEKWVETRKMIAEIRGDWRVEKEVIHQSIGAFERELKTLEKQVSEVDSGSHQAENELREIEEKKAALQLANDELKTSIGQLEMRIRQLSPGFPPPLMEGISALFNRIPKDASDTKWGLSSRLQNIVGILNELDKFNAGLTLVSELRKSKTGTEIQTRVLYVGLSQAYFIDKTGTFCGYGISSSKGWKWETRPDLASSILKVIKVYENEEPAQWVELPVNVE